MSKTRLIEAVQRLDLETTKQILDAKPSLLTVWNKQGRNLLHLACSASCKTLKVPESSGARMVNYQDPRNGKTALHYGVEREFDPALLRWLVKRGASPDIEDREGNTARSKATRKRKKQFLNALS